MDNCANNAFSVLPTNCSIISWETPNIAFNFKVPKEGWYCLSIIYSKSESGSKHFINIDSDFFGQAVFPDRQGQEQSVSITLYFTKGDHAIDIRHVKGKTEINRLHLTVAEEPSLKCPSFRCVNPNASSECHSLMAYLKSIYGKKILTGQQTTYAAGKEIKAIEDITGSMPAVRGFDLMSYSLSTDTVDKTEHCVEELTNNPGSVEAAIRWAKEQHGIVSFCWHWFSPLRGRNKSFYTEFTDFDAEKAVIEGTEEYDATIKDIDAIAKQLKLLQNEHIPVLWRPLHEADGGWFWWGAKGSEAYKKLYILLYHRLTDFHKINNLIWVWNAPADGWYPGDQYVDIVSADIYAPKHNYGPLTYSCLHTLSYADDKPVALGENGPLPDPDLLIRSKTPWLWFLTWGGSFIESEEFSTRDHIKKVYNHPYTVTLKDLPVLY